MKALLFCLRLYKENADGHDDAAQRHIWRETLANPCSLPKESQESNSPKYFRDFDE